MNFEMLLLWQVHFELRIVENDGMVNAATFQKEVQTVLRVVQVPPQLCRLEFARVTPSGTLSLERFQNANAIIKPETFLPQRQCRVSISQAAKGRNYSK